MLLMVVMYMISFLSAGASVIVLPVLAAVVVLAVVLGIVGRKWSQRRPGRWKSN